MNMQKKSWDDLVRDRKTLVERELCCKIGCKSSFNYTDLNPGQYVPEGWSMFMLPKDTLIGCYVSFTLANMPLKQTLQKTWRHSTAKKW